MQVGNLPYLYTVFTSLAGGQNLFCFAVNPMCIANEANELGWGSMGVFQKLSLRRSILVLRFY